MEAIEEVTESYFLKYNKDFLKKSRQNLKNLKNYSKQLDKIEAQLLKSNESKTKLTKNEQNKQKENFSKVSHISRAVRHIGRDIEKGRDAFQMISQNLLVMVVSKYDLFLTNILRQFFICQPNSVRGLNKSISIEKVIDLKTSKKIIESEIEKEVEGVLRDSHIKQIKYIEDNIKVDISPHLKILPDFVELTERRNLFIHNDGVVNERYIDNCKKNKALKKGTVKVGTLLKNNNAYMKKACEVIIETGLNISHIVFRKLCKQDKDKTGDGNNHLQVLSNRFLEDEKWDLAIMICDFGLSDHISSKCTGLEKLAFIFNKCIALKCLKKN
jgi:hypothetical protein